MTEKYYRVSEKRLLELIRCELKLLALERSGVDNWDWYDESLSDFIDEVIKEENIPEEEAEDFWFDDVAKIDIKEFEVLK